MIQARLQKDGQAPRAYGLRASASICWRKRASCSRSSGVNAAPKSSAS
ncbi:hypothetical protein L533_1166, partial [Bordetella bronchiseptica OSU553]